MAIWWLVAAVLLGVVCSSEVPPYRLPGDVVPHYYNISLLTDIDNFNFSGHVEIQIECKTATDTIKLHSVALRISDKDVTLKQVTDNIQLTVSGTSSDTDNDFLVIKVAEKLTQGSSYLLYIPFQGNLTDGLAGYYRSSYEDKAANTTKWLAVTQFEPTDARRAFPCFDEPAMKAKFSIRLGRKEHLKSASNMPLSSSVNEGGWVWDQYQESVPMSTYLVAFMVSEFEYRESDPEPNKVMFRVWARKEAIKQVEFTRKYGPKFLNFYEDFFGIPYPLPKQDMVAIPDFSAGAMENWGLITYRESQLLFDENVTSILYKLNIANTVAHELAHQWFGNLVTMKWWTDLWLNEGFATYVASLALQNQFPEWNAFNTDVADNLLSVFSLDALETSHPVSVPIGHPKEINQIFDAISYNKGSLLLHMMNSFLGDNVFKTGVSKYLKKFSYGNSEQNDLWASLTEEAKKTQVLPFGVTVKDIMDKWTIQTGYPVLTVRRDKGTITVTQKRFLEIPPKSGKEMKECWWVPLTYSTAKNLNFNETRSSHWLSCELTELSFDTGAGPDDWIILNNKASGIYRVNYDTQSWELLADALHSPNMTSIDQLSRLQLVGDAMALARTGDLDYSVALRVLKYIQADSTYLPWIAVSSSLHDLELILWRTEKYDQFKMLVQTLLSEVFKKFSDLSSVPTDVETIRHQTLITKWACDYQLADCVVKANQLFRSWMTSDTNPIPKDLRRLVYCEGIRQGGEAEWMFVWKQYQSSNIATEKGTFLSALSCAQQATILNRYLEWSIDLSSGVRLQDAGTVFYNIARNSRQGYKLAQTFLESNVQRIHNYLAPNTQGLGDYVSVLANRMVFPEEIDKMKKFVKSNQKLFDKSQLTVNQALETADSNMIWMSKFYDTISL